MAPQQMFPAVCAAAGPARQHRPPAAPKVSVTGLGGVALSSSLPGAETQKRPKSCTKMPVSSPWLCKDRSDRKKMELKYTPWLFIACAKQLAVPRVVFFNGVRAEP